MDEIFYIMFSILNLWNSLTVCPVWISDVPVAVVAGGFYAGESIAQGLRFDINEPS